MVTIGVYRRFRHLLLEGMPLRDQTGESKVTVPEGSATSYIPERVSRMEFTKSCGAIVLSTDGENCSD